MTLRTINQTLGEMNTHVRFDAMRAAENRLKARAYPRNSRGWVAYTSAIPASVPSLTLAQWRAVYALAARVLA